MRTASPFTTPTTGASPHSWRRAIAVVVLVMAAGAGVFLLRRNVVNDAMSARVAALADSGRFDAIVDVMAGRSLDDRHLSVAAPRFVGRVRIGPAPFVSGVSLTRVTPLAGFPLRPPAWHGAPGGGSATVVAGEYLLRAPFGTSDTLTLLLQVAPNAELAVGLTIPPADSMSAQMRVVSAGRSPTGATIDAFLVDRFEVSNADYQRFVSAGGYRNEALWPPSMTLGGVPMPRVQALAKLVDRTGLSGPRLWSAGRFPDGVGQHPVVGVTWYEAVAYAAWVGKALPTAGQWWRAALGESDVNYPWGRDGTSVEVRANLEGTSTRANGAMPLGVSPFGAEHMAGNAREWLADSTSGALRRIVVGGSWQDPPYMFERSHAESFAPGYANDAIGFRLVRPLTRR